MQETAQRKKFIEVEDNSDPLTNKEFKIIKPSPTASDNPSFAKTNSTETRANEEGLKQKSSVNWVTALAIVKFDIDQGNVLEAIYPPDILSVNEQKTLSFLAFPDSNSFSSEGGLKYIFKFQKEARSNSDDTLFGYTYFQQRKDTANARGFSQKSLVILSVFPFIQFFKGILDVLGSSYFEALQPTEAETKDFLKKYYEYIMINWQKPQAGVQNEISICGKKFAIHIPKKLFESRHVDIKDWVPVEGNTEEKKSSEDESSTTDVLSNEEGSDTSNEMGNVKTTENENNLSNLLSDVNFQERGIFQDINIYKLFRGNIRMNVLWKLWELVLTNQPLLIMSDSPAESSETVLGLISLIYPLEYQGDYKPYFTIYDPAYRQMQEMYDKKVIKCSVIGVTNPLFLKTMQGFPNILHLEEDYLKRELEDKQNKKPSLLKSSSTLMALPDPNLQKMLIAGESEEADAINNALLKRSIRSLTQSFLSVFETYFKLQINDIKKFEEKDFLKFVELQKFPFKAHFASQSDIIKVYAKFLKSSNFLQYIKSFPNVYFVKNIYK